MEKIKSFTKDHLDLDRGVYISKDKDIITVDVRLRVPYIEDTLTKEILHTMEHVFATVTRNLYPEETVYVGPMGCRTGFYFLFKLEETEIVPALKNIFLETTKLDAVPGNQISECGFALDFSNDTLAETIKEAQYWFDRLMNDGSIDHSIDLETFKKNLHGYDAIRLDSIYRALLKRDGSELVPSLSNERLIHEIELLASNNSLFR